MDNNGYQQVGIMKHLKQGDEFFGDVLSLDKKIEQNVKLAVNTKNCQMLKCLDDSNKLIHLLRC